MIRGARLINLLVLITILSGCAAVSVETSAMRQGDVRVQALKIPALVNAGEEYQVKFESVQKMGEGILLTGACFIWHTASWSDGPYCPSVREEGDGAVAVLITRNPNAYHLSGYLMYNYHEAGKVHPEQRRSNEVRSSGSMVVR
jgi:hypothetical protein